MCPCTENVEQLLGDRAMAMRVLAVMKQKAVYTHACASVHACAMYLCPSRGTYQNSLEVPAF